MQYFIDYFHDLAHHFETPFSDPVLIFALVMLLLLTAPVAVRKMKLPGIIGLLVAGAIAGPNALGLLERDSTFVLLGTVGLLYIMFVAGLEIDLNRFNKYRNHSIVFGAITFFIPQIVGTLMAYYVLGQLFGIELFTLPVSILLASMFASHTLLAYPIISKLGLSKNAAVTTGVGGTMITDTAALLVLAVVMGSHRGELDTAFWVTLIVGLSVYGFVVFWGVPKLGRWFFRTVGSEGVMEYVFVLAVVFIAAFLSEIAGVEAIIGAFMAGLALNRLIPESSTLMNRIEFVGNALFIPFFLVSVGMLIDARVLFASREAAIVAAAMVITVLICKWAAAVLAQKILGYSKEEGMVVFGLSVAQAAATLAVVLVAFEEGLFDETILNGSIIMIAVTCFVAPWVAEVYGRKLALAEQESITAEELEAPQRILIPMAYAATSQTLMDLTFLIREHGSEEPVYPLAVVPEDEETTTHVANAEKMLSGAVIHGASAEVPVVPVTRVAHNAASGIARAILERRISDVIVGWQGPGAVDKGAFGRVVEQLLDQTEQQVFICHLTHPINTFKRVIVVFPENIEHHPGYVRSMRNVKRLANAMGAMVTGLCMQDSLRRIHSRFETLKPELASTFLGFRDLDDVLKTLKKRIEPTDLVVFLSARRGTAPWSSELERLPTRLGDLADQSMVFLFPTEIDGRASSTARIATTPDVSDLFKPRRVVLQMPSMPFADAVRALLEVRFEGDELKLDALATELLREDTGYAGEVFEGVMLLHARTPMVRKPMVFIATSSDGLAYVDHQLHLVVLLVSPAETSLQDHLQAYSELGRILSGIDDVRRLAAIPTKTELVDTLKAL
jgi:Kef-type K+ transport system membrane component KefB/mannitol/fructose-specific phosphotransferase system IIA component (Ntr-type)